MQRACTDQRRNIVSKEFLHLVYQALDVFVPESFQLSEEGPVNSITPLPTKHLWRHNERVCMPDEALFILNVILIVVCVKRRALTENLPGICMHGL